MFSITLVSYPSGTAISVILRRNNVGHALIRIKLAPLALVVYATEFTMTGLGNNFFKWLVLSASMSNKRSMYASASMIINDLTESAQITSTPAGTCLAFHSSFNCSSANMATVMGGNFRQRKMIFSILLAYGKENHQYQRRTGAHRTL
jgi:hypothetical protein